MKDYSKPVPRIRELTEGFWQGCNKHELRVQQCKHCGVFRFPPQAMCAQCHSTDTQWTRVSGKGSIYSYIMPSRTSPGELPAKGFDYPYVVALIELADAGGVRMASNIVDCAAQDVEIGMPVEVVFDDVSDEITLPKFRAVLAGMTSDQ